MLLFTQIGQSCCFIFLGIYGNVGLSKGFNITFKVPKLPNILFVAVNDLGSHDLDAAPVS
jgi:hypothetical protein